MRAEHTMGRGYNISAGFLQSTRDHADRLFYSDATHDLTYREMGAIVGRLASWFCDNGRPQRIGILATRSLEAYAGILATGLAGAAYVPLSLKWPEERIVALLGMLGLDALVVDAKGAELLTPAVLAAAPDRMVISDATAALEPRTGQHVIRLGAIDVPQVETPAPVGPDDLAYILFTSGTTGMPKGVMIPAGAVHSYLEQAQAWTKLQPSDRIAETFDITFDLSVHDLLLCVEAGASLHMLSPLEMLAPGRAIRSKELTVWFSVPTLAAMMRGRGALKPNIFPSLRLSIFCGEPLPAVVALDWAAAAPNSVVENVYGPTEFTIACTRQTLTEPPVITENRNILAIGHPFGNTTVALFGGTGRQVADGQPGEIALSGPQLAKGYLNAPELTADRFREIDGQRWYLTGDLGMRDENGAFHHLGRIDNQIKLKGNRIELEEVEMHLRRAADSDLVAVVAWPVIDGSAQGLVGFCSSTLDAETIVGAMVKTLPRYMMPDPIHIVDSLPVNVNGKVDRRALVARLEEMEKAGRPSEARPQVATAGGMS